MELPLCDAVITCVVICTCVMDFLCDVDSLPVGQTSVNWRSGGWSQRRVECIDVKAQVDRSLLSVGKKGEEVKMRM